MTNQPEGQVAESLSEEIRGILTESESATLAVGHNLAAIVARAEGFVERLQASVGVIGSDGEGSVSRSISAQATATDSFVSDLGEVIKGHARIADQVISTTEDVSEAAQSVADVSSQARMLCFNTKIEAGRLGDQGRPFMVIADQMRELSEAIAQSNEQITELTSALTPLLRNVKSNVRSLEDRTREFTAEYADHRTEIESKSRTLQCATADTLTEGDIALADIIDRLGDSIVALQTQDIVSQRLKRVMSTVSSFGCVSDPGLEEIADVGFMSDGLADSDGSLKSGEMELF